MLPRRDLEPVRDVPHADDLADAVDHEALDHIAVVELNGGLGTSMGLTRAKSLIEARNGLSLLDVIARQTLASRPAPPAAAARPHTLLARGTR